MNPTSNAMLALQHLILFMCEMPTREQMETPFRSARGFTGYQLLANAQAAFREFNASITTPPSVAQDTADLDAVTLPKHTGKCTWLVTWQIDSDAGTPLEAAREAFAAMQREGTTATVFQVTNMANGGTTEVDLSKPQPGDRIEPKCRHCRSDNIAEWEKVERMTRVVEFMMGGDGALVATDHGDGDTLDETSVPASPDEPWYCRDCGQPLSHADILAAQ